MHKSIGYLKAKHLVMFLLIFISFLSFGQKFSVGFRASPLISWAGFGDKEDKPIFSTKSKLGYAGGILISFPLKANYDVVLEGGYSKRGRRLFFNKDSWENSSTYQFIDMSMLLRRSFTFHIRKNIPVQAFFTIGPEINYWMNAKGFLRVGGADGRKFPYKVIFEGDSTESYPTMYLNHMNRWLFSLSLGVGFRAPIRRNQHIITEVRFISGHTFLGRRESAYMGGILRGDGNFQDTQKTNLKTFLFSVGYTFDLDVLESRKGKSTLKKKIKRSR